MFNQGAVNLGSAYGSIAVDLSQAQQQLENTVRQYENRIAGMFNRVGSRLQSIGSSLTLTLAPFTVASAQFISTAIDFESAFAGVAKTVDATDEQLAVLEDTIRRMATDNTNPLSGLDNAHVTIAQIMELGGQLGVATDDLEQFAQTVGELTLATNLSAEEAALMIAQYANVSNMPMSDIGRFGASIVELGNNAATTEKDILSMASRIAAASELVGLSEWDVLAYSTALSSAGISAELGGTNFSRVLTEISTAVAEGGSALDGFAEISNLTAAEFATNWRTDASGALQDFIVGLSNLSAEQQILSLQDLGFTGQEVQRILLSLAGNTELLSDALETAWSGWYGFTTLNVDTYFQNFEEQAKSLGFAATTTAEDVAAMVSSIEDSATNFGFHGQQVYQYGAALANTGIQADVAGDAFQRILENITRISKEGGADLEFFEQIMGSHATSTVGWLGDMGMTLDEFLESLSKLSTEEQIGSLERLGFTGEETQAVMLALAGDVELLGNSFDLAKESTDKHNALTEEARRRLETTKSQVNALKNNFSELALTIGEQLLPIINDVLDRMLDFVGGIVDWLKENPEVARTIGLITVALGALGPTLFVVGRIVSFFGGTLGSIISIVRMFGMAFMAAFSPIGAIVAAGIALGVALYAAWESNFLGIRDTLLPVIESVGNALGDLMEWFGGLIEVFQAEGLSGAFDYFINGVSNLISGIWDAIRNVDWLELGASILNGIGDGISNIADWVYNRLIVPLAEGVSLYVESGQLWEDLQRLGDGILSAIAAGIELSNDIVTWVLNNLIIPLGNAVITYITSGQLWDNLVSLGSGIFDGIAFGLKSLADIASWVYSKVILPIAFGIRDYVTSGQLWDDLVALGTGIFNAIGAGIAAIGDIVEWILNNLIIPLGNAVLEYVGSGKLWEDLMSLGKSILDGLAAGLGNVAAWVQANIIDPILSPLETARDIASSITGTETHIGGSWRGRPGSNTNDEGTLPNPSSPPRDSGGPGLPGSIYRVGRSQVGAEFFGVGDQGHFYPDFMDNLTRIAGMVMRQNLPQFRGAEDQLLNAGGGGNVYNLEINVPLEILRDEPNLQRNADTFADQIMSRLRSR